ncbi:uncharacterized protein LOC129905538 isoform X1 [Episyrphus balteatus]|uniref:uncharacterized protein LOC129905538 isoform X1 n=1 Tax=Episyrphus balteatus TaxID=286459 RepID=UPI00248657AA|nr:uncharacterized protein LOC129905538 isoform X1 [Episyrphus balteatus]
MEWSMDDALQLIEQYRMHPELWNRAYPKYKDKLCRFRAWSNIAEAFGCSKAEVERKMNVLLTQYRREKHKLLMKIYNEGIQPGPSKWYAFKRFEFLEGGGGGDAALSMGVGRRKSRDMKYFSTMGLGLPLLIANSQSLTGWNGGGPFSPPNDRKVLCPMPIGFPNVQNSSDILNSRNNPFNQNQKTETTTAAAAEETIEIDEKDDEHQNQTTSSAASSNATPAAANNFSAQQDNEELAIKQEMSDFSHHPPLGRSDSHRSFDNSSPDDNRTENDEFAQDLRVSAAAQGIDFSRYSLARGLLQQSERYDSNCSPPPPLPRKHHQTNQMHSNAQQQSAMATSGNSNEQDDCDYVGSNVSIKLRSMERTQRIIAEKLISEVLFYGQIAELEKTAKIQPK